MRNNRAYGYNMRLSCQLSVPDVPLSSQTVKINSIGARKNRSGPVTVRPEGDGIACRAGGRNDKLFAPGTPAVEKDGVAGIEDRSIDFVYGQPRRRSHCPIIRIIADRAAVRYVIGGSCGFGWRDRQHEQAL